MDERLWNRFPEELLLSEVIPKLPVKSVFRFKTVSREWRYRISHPNFVLTSSASRRERVMLLVLNTVDGEERMSFFSLDKDFSMETIPHPDVPSIGSGSGYFMCCEGLVLFTDLDKMYLWNPSTKSCRIMAHLNEMVLALHHPAFCFLGFCFDRSSSEYKAVVVGYHNEDDLENPDEYAYTFRLTGGERSEIEFPYEIPLDFPDEKTSGVLVNNHLHWIVKRKTSDSVLIVFFDEEKDQFVELAMPPQLAESETTSDNFFGLNSFRGWLCVHIGNWNQEDSDNEVWVMKNHGVQDSWTKLFTIRGVLVPLDVPRALNVAFVTISDGLYTYNLETNSLEEFQLPALDILPGVNSTYITPFLYHETLESVDGM